MIAQPVDDEVQAHILCLGPDGKRYTFEGPLRDAVRLFGAGAKIERIWAPDPGNMLGWEAVAIQRTRGWHRTPGGLWVQGGLWIVRAADWRGLAAVASLPWRIGDDPDDPSGWHNQRPGDTRTIGERLLNVYRRSPIEGLEGRLRRALARLEREEAASLLAQSALEVGVGGDEFVLKYVSLADGRVRRVAKHTAPMRGRTLQEVRSAIAGRFLRDIESTAFGTGLASPRAKEEIRSLDEGSEVSIDSEFEARVEAADALAHLRERAGLTPREAEVFDLKCEDPERADADIAAHLGMSVSTVGVHWHHARMKLRRAGGTST